jgi:Kef-type K+ transport system membrane component KefB
MNPTTVHAAHFFLQLSVILIACRACGFLMRQVGQPAVVGEMVAGVLLGPSLLGVVAPSIAEWIFPSAGRPALFAVAQLGLTLYMFAVGLEFRSDLLRSNLRAAGAVSAAGILTPLALGAGLAIWLAGYPGFFAPNTAPAVAALFLGASLSITAFPMLARMIVEHRLTGTSVGTIALTAGSLDDVAAWILLAIVLGTISGCPWLVAAALGGGLLYALTCWKVVRPALAQANARCGDSTVLGAVAVLLVAGAWFTDLIGLYSVFGAFILGLVVPRGGLAEKTAERIGPVTSALLLPVFFTYSGLNTRIGLLDSKFLWMICAAVIVIAAAGKLFACYGAARWSGSSRSDALAIASLMNARGLMELILLNIGLQAGLISQTLFTILVVMAIATTLMAAPGFNASQKLQANGY